MTDAELQDILRRELLPGEELAWSARPDPKRLRTPFALWLFAVPWTVFALAWEAMALMPLFGGGGTPGMIRYTFGIAFPIFGLPFIAVGLAMLGAPFWARAEAARSIYGLTDRRVLRVSAGKRRTVRSVPLDRMGPIDVSVQSDGWGTLRIETGSHIDSDGDRVTDRFEVDCVPDVARLEALLLAARGGR